MKSLTILIAVLLLIAGSVTATTFTQGHNLNGNAITNASVVTAGGPVGIGTDNPRVDLDVPGHAAFGNAFGLDTSANASNTVITIQHITTNWVMRDLVGYSDLEDDGLQIKYVIRPAQQPESIKTYGGIYTVVQSEGAWNYDRNVAIQGEAIHRGTGSVNNARGIVGVAVMEGNGTMNYGVGGRFLVLQNFNTTGSSVISNAIGVVIEGGLNKGSTIRRAGMLIKACAVSTNSALLVMGRDTLPDGHFAIYNDSALSNYFKGRIGCGTQAPTAQLDVNGANGYNQLRLRTSYTPSSSADANGATGDMAWDADHVYVKTAAGWKRAALTTF
jgi:hypothetical protein